MTRPAGVITDTPTLSGKLWVVWKNSTVKGAEFDHIVGRDRVQVGFGQQLLLAQLDLQQPLRQRRGIDRRTQPLLDEVGERADVVFMAVRQDDAAHLLQAFHDVAGVGDDDVDAVHLARGKHEAGIDDQQILVRFQHEHVLANFAQAAQRNHPEQRGGTILLFLCHVNYSP